MATLNDEALSEDTDPDYELQYIDIGNVDSTGEVNQTAIYRFQDAPSRARRIVRDGDTIVSCVRTYLQAIAPIQNPPSNLVVSTGFAVVRPLRDKLLPSFARHALREKRFLAEVEMRSVGVSYPAINASDLADIRVNTPDLAQQQTIADYLDRETARIDDLIRTKERALGLLADKRKALITRAVTRGLDPSVPLRDSGISWLGPIPEHWETRKIAWLYKERDQRNDADLPLLLVSINLGVVPREFADDRIEATAADFNTYKIARKDDVVFNKMRMWQGAVGVAPIDGLVSPDYVVAEPSGEYKSEYAALLFRTALFSAECARRSHGIVWDRLRLYWEGFREIVVPLPPGSEQTAIAEHIAYETAKLDALRDATEHSIDLLKERRSALIASAVTGQINVSEAKS